MIKTWIKNNLILNNKIVSKRCKKEWFLKNNFTDKYEEIIKLTDFLPTDAKLLQRLWHIINNNFESYKCNNINCSKTPNFSTFSKGYLRTCSKICAQYDSQTINKIKDTNIKKYGVEYGLSNVDIIKKIKSTCLKNHGVDNPTKSKDILNKIKITNNKKYGVDWILRDQTKKEISIYKKYGVRNIQQSDEARKRTTYTRRSKFYDSLLTSDRLKNKVIPLFSKEEYIHGGYYNSFKFKCRACNTEFFDCLEDGDIPRCTNCYKNSSIFEEEVYQFIKSLLTEDILRNTKSVINPLEIDIFIPTLNLAFECNGLYWHGELNGGKDKKYHLNKTTMCETKNIRLIHIFEDEWLFKKDIVKSRIKHLLNKTHNKIYARNCEVKLIDSHTANSFLSDNHIQGKDKSSLQIGMFFNNELVSVMTFGKLRVALGNKNKQDEWELYRFCNKIDISIVGSASKLLNFFIKTYFPKKIITYSDKRWNSGTVYTKLNFVKVSDGSPTYWYFGRGNSYKRHHRFGFAKHTLSSKLSSFNPNLSEWENMKLNGYDRIWDCGHSKYQILL